MKDVHDIRKIGSSYAYWVPKKVRVNNITSGVFVWKNSDLNSS